ncbi:MAG: NAD(P)H-hydrate dehydratase [Terriglobia bacterium]
MKVLTAKQMQAIDRQTEERYGVPGAALMENAGTRVVEFIVERFSPLERHVIAILCGSGNNGGDGLVVARLLREKGLRPRVLLTAEPAKLQGDAAANYHRLTASGPPELVSEVAAWERIRPSLSRISLVIDALLGTGLSKPLGGFLLDVVREINRLKAQRIAIDLPSGLGADSGELIGECVHADASVTFTAPKLAHVFPPACEMAGELRVCDIGTPAAAIESDPELFLRLVCPADLAWLNAPRKMDSHKGLYGHVLLLAGSFGKTGAAALAAKAALRSGAGLVTVGTPKSALPVVASLGMEWMTTPLPETGAGTLSLLALENGMLDGLAHGKSVLAVGPGLGSSPETAEAVRVLVNRFPAPLVLDADGLNAFVGRMDQMKTDGLVRVLTPHPGEMARLSGHPTAEIQKHRIEVARDFATRYHVHLVLKGARTLIAAPDGRVGVNPTGNPGMSTGGTGDALTGLTAGLLAQFPDRQVSEVLEAAVYLHGLAGDFAARTVGPVGMIAGDLVDLIPAAIKAIRDQPSAFEDRRSLGASWE